MLFQDTSWLSGRNAGPVKFVLTTGTLETGYGDLYVSLVDCVLI